MNVLKKMAHTVDAYLDTANNRDKAAIYLLAFIAIAAVVRR